MVYDLLIVTALLFPLITFRIFGYSPAMTENRISNRSMRYAFDERTQKLVTLEQLIILRAEDIRDVSLDRRPPVLGKDLTCPECGNPVHVYGTLVASGFNLAGREVGNPKAHPLVRPGFRHYRYGGRRAGDVPLTDCPLYRPIDRRFRHLDKGKDDPQVKQLVLASLFKPEVQRLNRAVLSKLYTIGAHKPFTEDVRAHFLKAAKAFYRAEVLIEHPWLLPYILIAQEPFFERTGSSGTPYKVMFAGCGAQYIKHTDVKGRERVVPLPNHLQLFFRNRKSRAMIDSDKRIYPINEMAAYSLAGIPFPNGYDFEGGVAKTVTLPQEPAAAKKESQTQTYGQNMAAWSPKPQRLPGFSV